MCRKCLASLSHLSWVFRGPLSVFLAPCNSAVTWGPASSGHPAAHTNFGAQDPGPRTAFPQAFPVPLSLAEHSQVHMPEGEQRAGVTAQGADTSLRHWLFTQAHGSKTSGRLCRPTAPSMGAGPMLSLGSQGSHQVRWVSLGGETLRNNLPLAPQPGSVRSRAVPASDSQQL